MAASLQERVRVHARKWGVEIDTVSETPLASLAFGHRGDQPVVLKVAKHSSEESRTGEVLEAFRGLGAVRVYEHADGVALLERLRPGTPLRDLTLSGRDAEATRVLAGVIREMNPELGLLVPSLRDWGESFERYAASRDVRIPPALVSDARDLYEALRVSQRSPRLLHGDLHHSNVLFDDARGWLGIDPKGVSGELEYELGAPLRNPVEAPALFVDRSAIERRVDCFAAELPIDRQRTLAWAFAQAVLATIWEVEDGNSVDMLHPFLQLAATIRALL